MSIEWGAYRPQVAVVGGGPAGLMAADTLVAGGAEVRLFDAMASCGRKFLLAGKGGLNLTHGERTSALLQRYGARQTELAGALRALDGPAVRDFAQTLGIETFIGSSGRVFPRDLKAAPLLRAWLRRLRAAGVVFHPRYRCCGVDADGTLAFESPSGPANLRFDACVLALGGGSWPALGADGRWVDWLAQQQVEIAPLQPANCGFECAWSAHLRTQYASTAIKNIRLRHRDASGAVSEATGEFMLSAYGLEGNAVYALSGRLRDSIAQHGNAILEVDLAPARPLAELTAALTLPRGRHTLAHQLDRRAGIRGAKAALLRECLPADAFGIPATLAQGIKALPIRLLRTRPLSEAISSAGGVTFEALDERFMLHKLPGVFCAGEMLDWEAPTGGYLLTACLATGKAAAGGALTWLAEHGHSSQQPPVSLP